MPDSQLTGLLMEYAQNPARTLEEVAIKLQLSLTHAKRLMKKYAYAMAATVEDHDYPKRAAQKLGVSEDVALALESHVDQYADMKILNELRRENGNLAFLWMVVRTERKYRRVSQSILLHFPYASSSGIDTASRQNRRGEYFRQYLQRRLSKRGGTASSREALVYHVLYGLYG